MVKIFRLAAWWICESIVRCCMFLKYALFVLLMHFNHQAGRKETVLPLRRSLRIKEMKMKSSAKTTIFLPHEIILQILCCLHPMALARFKCVCKLWRESIEDNDFAHKHSINLLHQHPSGLLICKRKITIQQNEEYFEYQCFTSGLILERSKLENKYRVRNPMTKQVLDLPGPMENNLFSTMIYTQAQSKYKLFYLYKKELEGKRICGGFKILTLETDDTWRNIDIPEFSVGVNEKHSLLNAGRLLLILTGDYRKIVCVELESERISIIENIPKDFITAAGTVSVSSWNNKFSISRMECNGAGEWNVHVWVLEDVKEHKWAGSKISVNLSLINMCIEEVVEMRIMVLKEKYLWLSVNSHKHVVGYNIVDRNGWLVVRKPEACLWVKDAYYVSLAYLKGMKPLKPSQKTEV